MEDTWRTLVKRGNGAMAKKGLTTLKFLIAHIPRFTSVLCVSSVCPLCVLYVSSECPLYCAYTYYHIPKCDRIMPIAFRNSPQCPTPLYFHVEMDLLCFRHLWIFTQ